MTPISVPKQRLRSALAFTQSDLCLCCVINEWLRTKDFFNDFNIEDKPAWMDAKDGLNVCFKVFFCQFTAIIIGNLALRIL